MNIVDWILTALLITGAINGWRKGFVGTLLKAGSNIIGLIAAYKYFDDLALFMDDRFRLKEPLSVFLQTHLTLPPLLSQFQLRDIFTTNFGAYLDTILPQLSLKAGLLEYLESFLGGLQDSLQISLGEIIHQYLATALLSIAAFFIIWFLVGIILQSSARLFYTLTDKTILGQADSLAGLLVGALLAVVVLSVMLGLVCPLLDLANIAESSPLSPVFDAIAGAKLLPWFMMVFNYLFSKFTMGAFF